eukprot:13966580-Alexandrium_andersonii.AAC.1
MSGFGIISSVEQAASVEGATRSLLNDRQLLRGQSGGLPAVLDSVDAARCCIVDALVQVALGWPPGVTSAEWATK